MRLESLKGYLMSATVFPEMAACAYSKVREGKDLSLFFVLKLDLILSGMC